MLICPCCGINGGEADYNPKRPGVLVCLDCLVSQRCMEIRWDIDKTKPSMKLVRYYNIISKYRNARHVKINNKKAFDLSAKIGRLEKELETKYNVITFSGSIVPLAGFTDLNSAKAFVMGVSDDMPKQISEDTWVIGGNRRIKIDY